MIDLQQRAMTGTTLTLDDDTNTKPDQEQPFDIVEQLLNKDLEYTIEDDVEEGQDKDEEGMGEEHNRLEPGSLGLGEMFAMYLDLTQIQGLAEFEVVSILALTSTFAADVR